MDNHKNTNYKEYYQGKKVLITGGAGAIGTNLARTIAELGAQLVIILDDLSRGLRVEYPLSAQHSVREGQHRR